MNENLLVNQIEGGKQFLTPWNIENDKPVGKGKAKVFVMEWLTWATIAKWAAQGAVAWSAGKILDALSAKAAGTDAEFILKNIFYQVLASDALRKANSRLDGLIAHLRHYNLSPATSMVRLDYATSESQMLVSELQGLKMNGYKAWLSAVSLQIGVTQERVTRLGGSEKLIIMDIITNALKHAEDMHSAHIKDALSEFSEVDMAKDPDVPIVFHSAYCRYKYKNKWYVGPCKQINSEYEKHRNKVESGVRNLIVTPASDTLKEWESLYKSL